MSTYSSLRKLRSFSWTTQIQVKLTLAIPKLNQLTSFPEDRPNFKSSNYFEILNPSSSEATNC